MSGQARTGPFGGNNVGGQARHGTNSGYVIHRRYGQEPCGACRQARAEWQRAEELRRGSGYTLTHAEAAAALASRAGQTSGSDAEAVAEPTAPELPPAGLQRSGA